MAEHVSTKPITIKDIEALEACGIIREIVDGHWVDAAEDRMAGELHGAIATNVIMALGAYVKTHRLGRVYPDDTTYYHLAPDVAIEIISPSERAANMRAKLREYLRTGVRQVWQVHPDTQEVIVHRADGTVNTYEIGQTIPGADVLPGFELPVADVFES
jgi:Uma2 family endonuclease